ncbi:MAG: UbiA family prenyltransferase [Planctomycetia bacterium]|nr:UbiA family prenyltransferase [Planctomycetia bacterium]
MKKIADWLELFRFPNIFTIVADIAAAMLLAKTATMLDPESIHVVWALAIILPASFCLYFAGMVLNDVWDFDEDALERPERPLPSGRISRHTAFRAGVALIVVGTLLWGVAACWAKDPLALLVCVGALVCAIVAYDKSLKKTLLGPPLMGVCRGLNILAALCFYLPIASIGEEPRFLFPAVVALYIAGVTFYSRLETDEERERFGWKALLPALLFMAAGFGTLYYFGEKYIASQPTAQVLVVEGWRWTILVVFLGVMIIMRALGGYFAGARRVRRVMKQAIFMLFFIDAAVVFAACGLVYASAILALILPAMILGHFWYST